MHSWECSCPVGNTKAELGVHILDWEYKVPTGSHRGTLGVEEACGEYISVREVPIKSLFIMVAAGTHGQRYQ